MSNRHPTAALAIGALAALIPLLAPASQAAAQGAGHAPRQIGLAVAGNRAKATAAHVCEGLAQPPPCYVTGLESCMRLAPRRVECGVAVRFPEQSDDCVWTIYVFWKHGETTQSEGRSECHEAALPQRPELDPSS